jgi:hypothetical protein
MSLTELQIRNASQAEKPFKLADGRGLFLLVRPNGSKLFRFRYRHGGKQHDLSVGAYPRISLKEARLFADEARKLVTQGVDPRDAKKGNLRQFVRALRRVAEGGFQFRS